MTRSVVVKHRNARAMNRGVTKCNGIAGKCRGVAKLSEEPLWKCSELIGTARDWRGEVKKSGGNVETGNAKAL